MLIKTYEIRSSYQKIREDKYSHLFWEFLRCRKCSHRSPFSYWTQGIGNHSLQWIGVFGSNESKVLINCPELLEILLANITNRIRVHLYQASASTLRQLRDDASDSDLIENNGVTPELSCNPLSSDTVISNANRISSVIAELSQRWRWRLV